MQEKRSSGGAPFAAVLELAKIRITIAVTLSTLTGYILYSGQIDATALWVSLGVFLLASSSSALNQYQERRTDAMMSRTRKRPLPSRRLNTMSAIAVVLVFFLAGCFVLLYFTRPVSLGLGLLSFAWYNGLYTPLKYRTAFALIIGSVIGAIPPVIGWTAAGGEVLARQALFLAFFIYIWQVPHFILLLMLYGKDYKEAGLPVLTSFYPESGVKRIFLVWITGSVIAGIMLPFVCGVHYFFTSVLLIVLSGVLFAGMIALVFSYTRFRVRPAFILMNVYLLLVLIILSLDRLSI